MGVVTKPVGGILDLATGSATSFREIARSSKEGQPPRRYEPRCLSSSWKLLPFYTTYSNNLRRAPLSDLTQAQHLLAKFSDSCSMSETVVGFLVIQVCFYGRHIYRTWSLIWLVIVKLSLLTIIFLRVLLYWLFLNLLSTIDFLYHRPIPGNIWRVVFCNLFIIIETTHL